VASAGASPYQVVSAALSALSGHRHGGASARALAMLEHARTSADARADLVRRLRHGDAVPGFGHPLYPDGDPRAAMLLRFARDGTRAPAWRSVQHVWKSATALLHQPPNLDFGLAAVATCYGLPGEAPLLLFALGRTIGWIAHAMEEYASGQLIRPRARYVGPAPER
jgi:citrate synthase